MNSNVDLVIELPDGAILLDGHIDLIRDSLALNEYENIITIVYMTKDNVNYKKLNINKRDIGIGKMTITYKINKKYNIEQIIEEYKKNLVKELHKYTVFH